VILRTLQDGAMKGATQAADHLIKCKALAASAGSGIPTG
jgi:hypothetical protein